VFQELLYPSEVLGAGIEKSFDFHMKNMKTCEATDSFSKVNCLKLPILPNLLQVAEYFINFSFSKLLLLVPITNFCVKIRSTFQLVKH
jgi:hypothetical protein